MPSSRVVLLAILITGFIVGQAQPRVEKSYIVRSELVGVPLRDDGQSDALGLNLGAQQWQLDQFSWILLRFVSKNCCPEYTLLRSDFNYLVQFQYKTTDYFRYTTTPCEPQLDSFQLFFLEEGSDGGIKAKSVLQADDGTNFLQEWNLIRANSSSELTPPTGECMNDHFHLLISQETFEEPTSVAVKETNQPIVMVSSKDGKHGLESAVAENESDGLIMIVIPVTCCYWIYLGVCTVFRKMCGKCVR